MALRLGRIYPLHLFMLFLFLLFELVFASGLLGSADRKPLAYPYDFASFAASLFLVQPFFGADGTPWNGPSWSIAVEMWTYLAFALLYRWLRLGTVAVALLLAAGCAWYLDGLTDRYLNVFHDGALARCLYGFALGTVAYRLHAVLTGAPRLSFALASLLEAIAVVVSIALVVVASATPTSLAIPPLFFFVVLLFARQDGAVSRLLLLRPFLLVGALSYSIYMVHLFLTYRTLNALSLLSRVTHGRIDLVTQVDGHNQFGGSPMFGDLVSIGMLALTIACAALTYRFIERPAQRWSRGLILGDHPRPRTIEAEREAPTF